MPDPERIVGRPTPRPSILEAQPLCASSALVEGGDAVLFDVVEFGRAVRAFAVRFEGRAVAYVNRCAHVPVELDWQPGKFFDDTGRWLICAVHGAVYEPLEGHCVAGPCTRGRLKPIVLAEQDGQVCWYPTEHLQPAFAG